MRRMLFILCLAAALRPAPAPAGEEGRAEWEDGARILLEYQSYMRGDRDGAVRFTISASRDLMGSPLAETAVRLALLYEPAGLSNVSVGEAEARRILNAEAELSPGHRDILRRFVARSFASAGRREDAMQVHERRGLAMSWLVAGPFSGRVGAGFSSLVLPEGGPVAEEDVLLRLPDAAQFAAWRENPPWRRIPDNRSFPFVRPWSASGRDDDGAMLMFTTVDVESADNKSWFHIYAETSWRLYVDGALLSDVDRNAREVPVEHSVAFPLSPGRHTVMLQLFPPPLGVDRNAVRVALRLDSESAFAWDCAAAKPDPVRTVASRREAMPLRYLRELRQAAEENPLLMEVYALALIEQGMHDEAAWWAERGAGANPGDAFPAGIAGMATSLNGMLPPERRRDLAVSWHGKALAMQPDLVPSLLYLADAAVAENRREDAAALLDRAYAVNPESLDVLMARGKWAEAFAGASAARAAWEECARAFPQSSAAQLAVAGLPDEGFLDMERRLATCRAAYEAAPYEAEASLMLASALADSGNAREARSTLRNALALFAGDVGVLSAIAEIHARMEDYDAAIAVLSDAVRITPDNDALWRRLGDFHMGAGRREEAVPLWNASLAANPGQFPLRDMVDRLTGAGDDLLAGDGHDAIALTAGADAERYAGDVVRLLDRTVLTFARDGSYRRLSHAIDLARTRRGGEALSSLDGRGELLAARIVFANGNTLEPEPSPGEGGLRLPVVMPGASREIRALESASAGSGPPRVEPWFFQDPSGSMALLNSEYVVRAPRGFPLVYSVKNLGRDVRFERAREGDYDVYRWSAKLPPPRFEPEAVHVSERVPSVEVGMKTSWDELVFRELRRFEGRLTPSMGMRATLATLYRNAPGERPDQLSAARAIYRFVCDAIDPAPRGGSAAHIHAERMGDRNVLLLALLRAAGLDAHPAAARPAARLMRPPTWELPGRDVFPIPVVRLTPPDGGAIWLDTRFDSLPFGKIMEDLSGATVLSFLPAGPLFETLPGIPAEDSIILKERTITLPGREGGAAEISGRSLRRGIAGLLREQELANADAEARRNILLESVRPVFPDAVLRRFDVQRTDDSEASALERYEISSAAVLERRPDGTFAAPLCLLPPRVIGPGTRNLPSRGTACHIREVSIAEDRNVFRFPENARPTRVPEAVHLPSRFGIYQLRVSRRGDNTLEVIRNYHIPAQRIMPWDWEEFLAFLDRVDLAERQWVEYAAGE